MAITISKTNNPDTGSFSFSSKISPETEEKLREIEKHPDVYSTNKVLNGLRQKKAAGKECPDDLIWIAEKSRSQCLGMEESGEVSICCLPPLVFAFLTDPAGLIPWMLKTVKNKPAESFAEPVFYSVCRDYVSASLDDVFPDDGDPFAYKKNGSESDLQFEVINCSVDPCAAILGACFADQKKENALWYSLLKAYGKDRPKGWLSILPIVRNFRDDFNVCRMFQTLSVCADVSKMVDLLLYIKRRDSSMYAKMMSKYVYLAVLICGLDNLDDRNAFIVSMKKLYLEGHVLEYPSEKKDTE